MTTGSPTQLRLVIYGDFNCPFSALASARAGALEDRGVAVVDWRAVEHDPAIPAMGQTVDDALSAELERELADVRALLAVDEPDRLRIPTSRSNTGLATAAYAATDAGARRSVRRRLFEAYWQEGVNLSDPGVVEAVAGPDLDEGAAAAWRAEWASLAKPIVPLMVLPDGYVSRGLGALGRLRQLLE